MSKGTKVVTFRLPPDMEAEMLKDIRARNLVAKESPWTISDYIKKAIAEKLAHARRSRKPKGTVKR